MNSFIKIDEHLLDHVHKIDTGYNADRMKEDSPEAIRDACGAAARDFPSEWWIEPREWEDWARKNDENHTWPMNYIDRYTNQDPTHECTCHSLTRAGEGAWNLGRGIIYRDGPQKGFRYAESQAVWFSPLSIYAEANPRQWGGANVRQVMEIACDRGFLPDKIQPREYGFKHTLQGTTGRGNNNQSSGKWVGVRDFPEGWQETAKHFRPLEVVFAGSWEEAVCCVLRSRFYCVGRKGHAIPWGQWLPGQGMAYPDSYDVTRYDSQATVKSAWEGGFAIASMTVPDSWQSPGG